MNKPLLSIASEDTWRIGIKEQVVRNLITLIGEDPTREGLQETPRRFLEALTEWTSGYDKEPADILKTFIDGSEHCDALVFQGSIPIYSHCEHHLTPFFGVAHVAYIPSGRIVGLSKLARLVDIFAKRLQVQERITNQVANALVDNLAPIGVGVVLQCRHLCMESRGVQKAGTITITSALRGALKDEASARAEFMSMVVASSQGFRAI